jgi:hypothetical protein
VCAKFSSNFYVDRIREVYPPFVVARKLHARAPQMDSSQFEDDRRQGEKRGSPPVDANFAGRIRSDPSQSVQFASATRPAA